MVVHEVAVRWAPCAVRDRGLRLRGAGRSAVKNPLNLGRPRRKLFFFTAMANAADGRRRLARTPTAVLRTLRSSNENPRVYPIHE